MSAQQDEITLSSDPTAKQPVYDYHHHNIKEEEEFRYNSALVLFFIFFGFLLGGLLREFSKRFKIPYAPILILVGLALGYYRDNLGILGQATFLVSNINPHIMLFIFIPILIFEAGFSEDWFIIKKQLLNILLLATPGVLLQAFLLAATFKLMLGYDDDQMSWMEGCMIGSIISVTDTVAVTVLFKEVGGPTRFRHLIEGESLFNDGTCMVFYAMFSDMAKGKGNSLFGIILNFSWIAGVGPILGVGIGFISCYWLRKLINDDILTITITVFSCYLTFYCAEYTPIHVSGLLAISCLGLFMSAFGRTKIYAQSEYAVHCFWAFFQYTYETMIFLLTGVIVGIQMLNKSTVTVQDWYNLIIFFIMMLVIRGIMIIVFLPFILNSGYGLSMPEYWVLIWGGIRGALGLCLSLVIGKDEELPHLRARELAIFFMAGTTFLTLVVNGMTCKQVCIWTKLINRPEIKDVILTKAVQKMQQVTAEEQKLIMQTKYITSADSVKVSELTAVQPHVFKKKEVPKTAQNNTQMKVLNEPGKSDSRTTYYGGMGADQQPAVLNEARFKLLNILKGLIWERFEEGLMTESAQKILQESCMISLDINCAQDESNKQSKIINVWDHVADNFTNKWLITKMHNLKDTAILGRIARQYIFNYYSVQYQVTTSFLVCAEESKHILEHSPFKVDWIVGIYEEMDTQIENAQKFLQDLNANTKTIITIIHTKNAAKSILENQKHGLKNLKSKGYIDDLTYDKLKKGIDRKIVDVDKFDPIWKIDQDDEFSYNQFTVFQQISDHTHLIETDSVKEKKSWEPNSQILGAFEKDVQKYVHIITQGSVQESIDKIKIIRTKGDILTPALIVGQGQSKSQCIAIDNVKTQLVPIETFYKIMQECPLFRSYVYKASLITYVHSVSKDNNNSSQSVQKLQELTKELILQYAEDSQYHEFNQYVTLTFPNGAYLFDGSLTQKGKVKGHGHQDKPSKSNKIVIKDLTYLPPSNIEYEVSSKKPAVVLVFKTLIPERKTYEQDDEDIDQDIQQK